MLEAKKSVEHNRNRGPRRKANRNAQNLRLGVLQRCTFRMFFFLICTTDTGIYLVLHSFFHQKLYPVQNFTIKIYGELGFILRPSGCTGFPLKSLSLFPSSLPPGPLFGLMKQFYSRIFKTLGEEALQGVVFVLGDTFTFVTLLPKLLFVVNHIAKMRTLPNCSSLLNLKKNGTMSTTEIRTVTVEVHHRVNCFDLH